MGTPRMFFSLCTGVAPPICSYCKLLRISVTVWQRDGTASMDRGSLLRKGASVTIPVYFIKLKKNLKEIRKTDQSYFIISIWMIADYVLFSLLYFPSSPTLQSQSKHNLSPQSQKGNKKRNNQCFVHKKSFINSVCRHKIA